MCDLVEHARRELELAGYTPEEADPYLKIMRLVVKINRGGNPPIYTLITLDKLLHRQNLTPLTDNPAEWDSVLGVSKRNHDALSDDGGKSYFFLSENIRKNGKRRRFMRKHKTIRTGAMTPVSFEFSSMTDD